VTGDHVAVLIVDDQAPFRRAARAVVTVTPGFEVSGEAETGEQAVELAASLEPGLVLMDINLPGINGIEATRQITDCGAVGYVNKEEFGPAIIQDFWAKHAPA